MTENISLYVEYHIKEASEKHPSYLQDTPHFLRVINKLNEGARLPHNAMLVISVIIYAYHNIPLDDGRQCLIEVLEEREVKAIPSYFLVELMNLIQKYNIFEFHDGQLWKQLIGVAMGIHPAPSVANIFLARRIEKFITQLGKKYGRNNKSAFKIAKLFWMTLFNYL